MNEQEKPEGKPVVKGEIRCARCGKLLFEVEIQSGSVKIKCRSCGWINHLSV